MAIDYKWMGNGGTLLDDTGDITLSTADDGIRDMVRSRLKADLNGWRLYRIGANLQPLIGNAVDAQLESVINRQVVTVLSKDLLPRGSFQVRTIANGGVIDIFVYVNGNVIATVSATRNGNILQVQAVN